MADLANVALVITSCGGSISTILVAIAKLRDHDDDDDDDYERRARKLERRAARLRAEDHERHPHRRDDDVSDEPLSFTRWAWRMT